MGADPRLLSWTQLHAYTPLISEVPPLSGSRSTSPISGLVHGRSRLRRRRRRTGRLLGRRPVCRHLGERRVDPPGRRWLAVARPAGTQAASDLSCPAPNTCEVVGPLVDGDLRSPAARLDLVPQLTPTRTRRHCNSGRRVHWTRKSCARSQPVHNRPRPGAGPDTATKGTYALVCDCRPAQVNTSRPAVAPRSWSACVVSLRPPRPAAPRLWP